MTTYRLLGLLLIALVTAGCVDCTPAGPPVSARGIGIGTDTAGGSGDFTLTLQVTDEPGGSPLPGAGVVAYWGGDSVASWRGQYGGSLEVREEGGEVVLEGDRTHPTPEDRTTVRLRTSTDGTAELELPENRVFGLVVAADGYTEEWFPALASGADGGQDTLVVPLYRARLNVTVDGTWGPGGLSTGFVTDDNFVWKADELPFGETDAAKRGYAERMISLQAHLRWTNGPQGAGDLGIGVGDAPEQPSYFHDEENELTPGEHGEAFRLDARGLAEHGLLGSARIYVGPATDTGYVGPAGLPYTLELEAAFDPAIAARSGCISVSAGGGGDDGGSGLPGTSVPVDPAGAVAALALAAAVLAALRRRSGPE